MIIVIWIHIKWNFAGSHKTWPLIRLWLALLCHIKELLRYDLSSSAICSKSHKVRRLKHSCLLVIFVKMRVHRFLGNEAPYFFLRFRQHWFLRTISKENIILTIILPEPTMIKRLMLCWVSFSFINKLNKQRQTSALLTSEKLSIISSSWWDFLEMKYRKILNISPGHRGSQALFGGLIFGGGLYSEGLVFGGYFVLESEYRELKMHCYNRYYRQKGCFFTPKITFILL